MSGKIDESGADPRRSAPGKVELVAEAVAAAASEALKRHFPNPGSAGPYKTARALRSAMNILIGPDSADSFIMLEAGRIIEEFEAKRRGVM